MKNKKLLAAVGVIVLLLVIYAVVSRRDRAGNLPDLGKWSGSADEILIQYGGETLRIYGRDGKWLLGDKAYPADKSIIDKMEEKLRDLDITDVSSTRPFYERFDLTPESALHVIVRQKGAVMRDIFIGKKSSKTSHTFIRLADRPEVFKASGMLRHDFERKLQDLRDKVVFDIKREDVDSFEIRYKGRGVALNRIKSEQKSEVKKAEETSKGKRGPVLPKAPDKWVFADNAAQAVDHGAVSAIISSFGPLRLRSFPETGINELRNPLCTVRVKSLGKEHELVIYPSRDGNLYPCTSPDVPYVFELMKYAVERYFRERKDFTQ